LVSNAPPESVTVWSTELLFCQHTVCPWVIVTWLEEKVFELVAFTLAAAPLEPHELATLVELPPHDMLNAATITPLMVRIDRITTPPGSVVSRTFTSGRLRSPVGEPRRETGCQSCRIAAILAQLA